MKDCISVLRFWLWVSSFFIVCSVASADVGSTGGILVDVGHTFDAPGAISSRGKPEYFFNQRFAQELATLIQGHMRLRASVLDFGHHSTTVKQRAEGLHSRSEDLLVSIHHDSVQPSYLKSWSFNGKEYKYCDAFSGYSIFVSRLNGSFFDSIELARAIGEVLVGRGFTASLHHAEDVAGERRPLLSSRLGIYRYDELAVLRAFSGPAILFEAGIIVNREEEGKLESREYRLRLVGAVAQGIVNYISAKTKGDAQ